ncbi:helix-turn-helix domain-containing protein [Campylobacter porcelli]
MLSVIKYRIYPIKIQKELIYKYFDCARVGL